mgnify:CR=1 FL=1
MIISSNYIAVKKPEPKEQEGFETVEVQDESIFKGVVEILPDMPVYIGNRQLAHGDTVVFAKYSPDTHDISELKLKFINIKDVLAVL